ncbi:MAG: aminotransferase class III-fold pyridoxal phosphate-dependent enzyme [Chloroflexi bacterium]|nr:aminotransferase class III-fold pyridoxal phosphate-dependent enzyme [Chloroflexota bacterium]
MLQEAMFQVERTIRTPTSEALHREALNYSTLGVNAAGRYFEPYPLYFKKGQGSRIWDADGNEFLDLAASHGSNVLGHAYPEIVDALVDTMRNEGVFIGNPGVKEVQLSKVFCELIPCAEHVYFTGGGGSDPIFFALRAAKALTGRKKILRLEGSYHGWSDLASISVFPDPRKAGPAEAPVPVPDSLGIPDEIVENTLVVSANDEALLERVVTREKDNIAAIIVEPVLHSMGVVRLKDSYLRLLRQLCDSHGIVLIFDEVLTGFRHDLGGAQKLLGVTPDMGVFGKAMTNGHAVIAALAGKKDVMSLFPEKAKLSGTYVAHLLGVTAALKTIEILKRDDGAVHKHISRLGDLARDGINEAARQLGVKARSQSFGSIWCVYPTDKEVTSYRDLLTEAGYERGRAFAQAYRTWLLNYGIMTPGGRSRAHMMLAHTDDDVERIIDATKAFFTHFRSELRGR